MCRFAFDLCLSRLMYLCSTFLNQDMSGSATLLSIVACTIGFWNWFTARPELPTVSIEEPQTAPSSEFACSCSCPAPSVQVVAQSSAGFFDWKGYCILALALLWLLSLCLFYRRRAEYTYGEIWAEPSRSHGFVAIDDYSDAVADRRSIHVRRLRRGGGTMA